MRPWVPTGLPGGRGEWYGAFDRGHIVGTLGVFRAGELARFQLVGTDPDHERRGVCRTLVHRTARLALDGGARALVMCADAEYHAARVYESVGFVASEKLTGVLRA